jgi:hypothetical protein
MVAGSGPDHSGNQHDAFGAQQSGQPAGRKLGALLLVVMPGGVIDRIVKPDGGLDALRIGQSPFIAAHQAQHGLDMREVMIVPLRRPIGARQLIPELAVYQRHRALNMGGADKGSGR